MTSLSACLEALEREHAGSPHPVIDHEILRSHTGQPDEFRVWLVCRSRDEQLAFRDAEFGRFSSNLRRRMLAAGFSENAVASLEIRVTSREETASGFPVFR